MKEEERTCTVILTQSLPQSKCPTSGRQGNICPRFLLLCGSSIREPQSGRDWIGKEELVVGRHGLHKHLHIKKTLFISQWNESFEAKLYNLVTI